MKKRFYLILASYMLLFAIILIGFTIIKENKNITGFAVIYPDKFNEQEGEILFNITINNTDKGQDANITQVNITLPDSFLFINDTNGTNTLFETFKNTSNVLSWSNFTKYLINGSVNNSYFWFKANASAGEYNITITTLNGTGDFSKNISINITAIPPACEPNWTEIIPECQVEEKFTSYWNDTNNCGEDVPEDYEESIYYCDNNSNKVIGNFSSFSSSGRSLKVYVNNTLGNASKVFSGIQKIEFKDENSTRIEFNWDFSNNLNMYEIHIGIQPISGKRGYILIKNINVSKKVFVDRLNESSNSVCVKDSKVNSLSELSKNCSATDEKIVPCPGSNTDLTCEVVENQYKVSGIMHSLVAEFTDPNNACETNWSCSEWGECLNETQTRTCTDSNNCGTDEGKPSENQSCIIEETCDPLWTCSKWEPKECPKEKTQTRICTDSNNCGTDEGKPSETKTCTAKKSSGGLFVALIIFLILIISVIVFFLIKMRKKIDSSSENSSPPSFSQPPPATPPPTPPLPPPQKIPLRQIQRINPPANQFQQNPQTNNLLRKPNPYSKPL